MVTSVKVIRSATAPDAPAPRVSVRLAYPSLSFTVYDGETKLIFPGDCAECEAWEIALTPTTVTTAAKQA